MALALLKIHPALQKPTNRDYREKIHSMTKPVSKIHVDPALHKLMSNQSHISVIYPGWPEIFVGLSVLALIGYGGGSQLYRLELSPVTHGLAFTALSGIAGLAGFAAATSLRIRSLEPFGIRRTSLRWLMVGVIVGLVAFVVKSIVLIAIVQLTGIETSLQDVYAAGGGGGTLSLVLATLFLGLVTPVGEEFLFRGVVASALLRRGP